MRFFPQIVPFIEKEFLENEGLQGIHTTLHEKWSPQLPPFQAENIKDNDDLSSAAVNRLEKLSFIFSRNAFKKPVIFKLTAFNSGRCPFQLNSGFLVKISINISLYILCFRYEKVAHSYFFKVILDFSFCFTVRFSIDLNTNRFNFFIIKIISFSYPSHGVIS